MPEKLAIVTIDAGSNVTGKSPLVNDNMVGTSSSKGTMADGIREKGGIVYDSGRAYRTITLAAAMDGVDPNDAELVKEKIKKWDEANRFGHCDTGLTLDGHEIDEALLHGEDISKKVAHFSPLECVRALTKRMKAEWLLEYASSQPNRIIGFDGREMRKFVLEEAPVISDRRINFELVVSFYMIVDVIEAARRRMSQRGVLKDYNDPRWMLHPKLNATVDELLDRAKRDESRSLDPVGIPNEYCAYEPRDGKLRLRDRDSLRLPSLIMEKTPVLIDTTGIRVEEVKSTGLGYIATALQYNRGFPEITEDLLKKLAS